MQRRELEAALETWREAERHLTNSSNGNRDALQAAVAVAREEFHRLSGEYMLRRIDDLKEAESRRLAEMPSSAPYHAAAKDETEIAADIWGTAELNDKGTPDEASRDN
jgi:signal transduction protein with GAF and PtsI domain